MYTLQITVDYESIQYTNVVSASVVFILKVPVPVPVLELFCCCLQFQ